MTYMLGKLFWLVDILAEVDASGCKVVIQGRQSGDLVWGKMAAVI